MEESEADANDRPDIMSNGAITLQCPNCHGVFLTLHQKSEGMETCPHCAVAVLRSQYSVVQEEMLHRARVQLPARRIAERVPSIPAQSAPAPVVAPAPAPVHSPAPLTEPVAPAVAPPPVAELPAPVPASTPAPVPVHPVFGPAASPLNLTEPSVAPQGPSLTPFGTPAPAQFPPQGVDASQGPAAQPPLTPAFQQPPVLTETISFNQDAPGFTHIPTPGAVDPASAHRAAPPLPAVPSAPAQSPSAPPPLASSSPFFSPLPPEAVVPPVAGTDAPAAPPEPPPTSPGVPATPAAAAFANFGKAATTPAAAQTTPPLAQPVRETPKNSSMGTGVPTANPATPPPAWPGLGLAVDPHASPDPKAKGKPGLQLQPLKNKAPSSATAEVAGPTQPAPESRMSAAISLLVLGILAILGWAGWHLWEKPLPVVIEAPVNPSVQTAPTPVPATPPVLPDPEPTPAPAPAPPAAAGPQEAPTTVPMPEETRRAVPATEDTSGSAALAEPVPDVTYDTAAADKLMAALESAETMEERLRLIAEPEKHAAEVESFFASLNGHLDIGVTEPNPGNLIETSTQRKVQMFRTLTRRCPTGAMVRLIPGKDLQPLLDWPLFIQSHNYQYDSFANSSDDREQKPRWFTVLCKRSHDFELKSADRDSYISLNAQGSLSTAGTTKVYVHKDSMAGRYLESKMNWDATYLSRVLLGKGNIGDKTLTVVLDCAGATLEH